ncbi:MAG: glycosyltransferase family 2 protein [Chloroflexi bacterium]|nr:glycosyltransferase family 2 protein [Chloroflexota bacterium]
MADLTVVVVSFNTRDLLARCLDSIERHGGWSIEAVVVDNASSDGSAAMVRARFPAVWLIANGENRGFAAATNQGLRLAEGRYVVLLNPDTVVQPGALATLAGFLDRRPQVGVVGPQLLNADGTLQHGCFRFPTLLQTFFDFFPLNHRLINSRLNGRYPLRERSEPFPVDHPLGACLMTRREVVAQVGLLDEQFFIYCEEIDWCIRIRAAGWEIFCHPGARVVHLGGQSTSQRRWPMLVELHRSRRLLFQKHYPPIYRLAHRAIVGAGLLAEIVRSWIMLLRRQIPPAEYRTRLTAFRAILSGAAV